MRDIFFHTNNQKVLRFLVENNDEAKSTSEIRLATAVSKAGVSLALRFLVEQELVKKEVRGKTYFYRSVSECVVIKQLKILISINKLYQLIGKISPYAERVILFGSASRGENLPDSDIDLLVISRDKDSVRRILKKFKKLTIKPIIKTPLGLEELKEKEPLFFAEAKRGIILFDKNER